MTAIDRLFHHDAFDYTETGLQLQFEAMRQCFAHHYEHCQPYRNVCDRAGFRPPNPRRIEDLDRIPWIFSGVLKERDLISIPRARITPEVAAGERETRIHLDQESLDRLQLATHQIQAALGALVPDPTSTKLEQFEHGLPFVHCAHHRLHVPIYSRVLVRDPESLAILPHGTPGLLQLQTPYVTSSPGHCVLTTDLARVGSSCGCGLPGPVVTILGHGGVKKHKSCSLTARPFARP